MLTVTIKMYDELNEVDVERTIDGSNLMVSDNDAPSGWECNILGNEKQIKNNLERWIDERGNEQHETILTLVGWEINQPKN